MRQKLLKREILIKKALYCFLAILTAFPLNLVIIPVTNATNPSLDDAKAVCDNYVNQGKTVVMFSDGLIQNRQPSRLQAGPVVANIPAGAYEVTLISHDGYDTRDTITQPEEQWYATLLDSNDDEIVSTGVISDLEDLVKYTMKEEVVNTDLAVSNDATSVIANHANLDPNVSANSVYPVCAIFNPIIPDNPAIAITKTANPTSLPVGGGNADYTYVVTNPGNVPLSNIVLMDDQLGVITSYIGDDGDNILAITETWIYTQSANITVDTINIAVVKGEYNSQTVQADDDATVTVVPPQDNPVIDIVKTANPTSLPAGGGNVDYTYIITNPGNVSLENVVLTDDKCSSVTYVSGDDNSNDILEITEIWTYTCGMNITVDTTNIATVEGIYNSQIIGPVIAEATVIVETPSQDNPAIAITKTANPTSLPVGGGNVVYTYVVTNPGDVALTDVKLNDDKLGAITSYTGDDNSDDILDITEIWTYTQSANITANTTNVATVEGCHNTQKVEATANASVSVSSGGGGVSYHPAIRIIKTPEPRTLPVGGGEVIYTYEVINPGHYALSNVTLVDDKCDGIEYKDGDKNTNDKLDRGEIWEYTCQANLTETITNTVVVTGESVRGNVTDTTKATVTVPTVDLAIKLEKTANPESLSEKGGLVTYSYEVFNEGIKVISDVTLVDDKCAPVIFVDGDINGDNKLDLTEVWKYTCEANITKTTTNIGTARGQVDGKYATDIDDAIVRVEKVKGTAIIPKEMPKTGRGEDMVVNNNRQQIFLVIATLAVVAIFRKAYRERALKAQ